jgi:hypothetical protein
MEAGSARKRMVKLTTGTCKWVPVYEVRGEGLFIQFKLDKLEAWSNRPEVQEREAQLLEAHRQWRRDRDLPNPEAHFPGIKYVLMHSFSHALMRQFSLECGYSAASLRERIYAREAEGQRAAMAGILLYTSAPDSEGTLGGLVALGNPEVLAMHFEQALDEIATCAADPLCSEHDPTTDASLHAAACHACLFSSETSCERGNRYLDRVLLLDDGLLAGWH